MQVKSVNGKRTIRLTKTEHDKLTSAQRLLAEIGEIAKDEDAARAAMFVNTVAKTYPAPEPKKQGTLT